MLAEIIIYIALFSSLFSGAFAAAFQTIDAINYLENKKDFVEGLYFLQSKLNLAIKANSDWNNVSQNTIMQTVSGSGLSITFVSNQLFLGPGNFSQVLLITLNINNEDYVFSYEK